MKAIISDRILEITDFGAHRLNSLPLEPFENQIKEPHDIS
jgi:hypothetical protein